MGVLVPKQSGELEETDPFSETTLEEVYAEWTAIAPHLADLLLVLAWTGLRWAEARALRFEDVMQVPTPGLLARRSQPEGQPIKATGPALWAGAFDQLGAAGRAAAVRGKAKGICCSPPNVDRS